MEPLDNLTNCEAVIAAFERATGRALPRPALPLAGAAGAPLPIPPTGFTVEVASPCDRTVLSRWPDDGWQRGTVARLCQRGACSHVVAYFGRRRRCGTRRTRCSTPPLTARAWCFSRRARRRA